MSDVLGVSGRRMIEAIIAGVRNPHKLAAWPPADQGVAQGLVRCSAWRLTEHHRRMLELYLGQHDA